MPTVRIHNTEMSRLQKELPHYGQKFFWDDQLKGFGVKLMPTGIMFVVQRKIGGKAVRHIIGRYGEISPAQARDQAAAALSQIRQGIDLNKQARERLLENTLNSMTLKEAFDDFLASRTLKPRALQTYEEVLKRTMPDWLGLPLLEITPEMVQKKHKQISTAGKNKRGKGSANQAMRVLRAVFNYVIATKRDAKGKAVITENPVKILSTLGTWNKLQPRENYIKDDDLMLWYEGINLHTSDKLKDFFLFLLFSGCRRNEAACLQWADIDFKSKTFTIKAENNKTSRSRELPLSDILLVVLNRRKQARVVGNPYVFVGNHNKGHLIEPKKAVATHVEKTSIKWCAHDLRRTYCTVASRLDTNYLKLKALVGHSVTGDITSKHYVQTTVDDLRQPMQQIADYLKEKMGMKNGALIASANQVAIMSFSEHPPKVIGS